MKIHGFSNFDIQGEKTNKTTKVDKHKDMCTQIDFSDDDLIVEGNSA